MVRAAKQQMNVHHYVDFFIVEKRTMNNLFQMGVQLFFFENICKIKSVTL